MKFAVPNFDIVSDFFGNLNGIKFSVPGSQWFLVPSFMSHLASEGFNTYFETLPEVFVRRRANGAPITVGNLIIDSKPEIVCLENNLITKMEIKDRVSAFKDSLCIAYRGNKKQIDLCDLKDRPMAIPNPATSSSGMAFKEYYEKKCGYYGDLKVNSIICNVPHREIPQKILNGQVDYGIMWESEAKHWKFKNYFPYDVSRNFSWLLIKNSSPSASDIFNRISSGDLNIYYTKYHFKLL
ncbi:substrate-binding domain-containing protein [Ferroplasma sp.]|uniref:substrate-binding domain-containing protein n=1 Tax=Ferroplasma sp. TaxID=2591003 RepID=UPI00307EEF41